MSIGSPIYHGYKNAHPSDYSQSFQSLKSSNLNPPTTTSTTTTTTTTKPFNSGLSVNSNFQINFFVLLSILLIFNFL